MTDQPITHFLADRLAELDDEALQALAMVADVPIKTARRAASGEPVAAWAALCLIAARGYDPITREQIARRKLGKFDHRTLALFMSTRMRVKKYTVRNVTAETGFSTRVVQNILKAEHVNLSNVVKACVYLNIHPFDQCEKVREAA